GHPDSFGAICGGEVTVLIEPQSTAEAIYLVGAGHCAKAIAQAARTCGLRITVIEDRADIMEDFEPADCKIADIPAFEFISQRDWKPGDAIILVNRSYQLDRDALKAALGKTGFGYLGMMGSSRKVLRVYDELKQCGVDPSAFERVHAPIGLDIGADSPEEIAISILAEILAALRHRSGRLFQLTKTEPNPVQMSTSSLPLTELNRMDRSSFVGRVGWVYEHSPWVAEKAWEHRPFADLDALHSAMDAIVQAAPEEK